MSIESVMPSNQLILRHPLLLLPTILWLHPLILSGVISPLISSSILGAYRPGEFIFQYSIFLPFILFMGFSRQEYWNGLLFPSPVDHILSDLSTMTHPFWVAPRAWISFIEFDKAVVHVIRLASCLWLWFQSALWSPLSVPTVLLGFLLPWGIANTSITSTITGDN